MVTMICFLYAGMSVYSEEKRNSIYIYEYKKELGLTDTQEKSLKNLISEFQTYAVNKQKTLSELRTALNRMIQERADLDKIRANINAISRIQAEIFYQEVVNNREIETELTGTQLGRWRSIQAEFARSLQQKKNAESTNK